jgi:hypothetical protein
MIGIILTAAAVLMAVALGGPKKAPPPPPEVRGYMLSGCSDIVILSEETALKYAREVGLKSKTIESLRVQLNDGCKLTAEMVSNLTKDPKKFRFLYVVYRAGLGGYVAGGGTMSLAQTALSQFAAQAQFLGIDTMDWPKGIPA